MGAPGFMESKEPVEPGRVLIYIAPLCTTDPKSAKNVVPPFSKSNMRRIGDSGLLGIPCSFGGELRVGPLPGDYARAGVQLRAYEPAVAGEGPAYGL